MFRRIMPDNEEMQRKRYDSKFEVDTMRIANSAYGRA